MYNTASTLFVYVQSQSNIGVIIFHSTTATTQGGSDPKTSRRFSTPCPRRHWLDCCFRNAESCFRCVRSITTARSRLSVGDSRQSEGHEGIRNHAEPHERSAEETRLISLLSRLPHRYSLPSSHSRIPTLFLQVGFCAWPWRSSNQT